MSEQRLLKNLNDRNEALNAQINGLSKHEYQDKTADGARCTGRKKVVDT